MKTLDNTGATQSSTGEHTNEVNTSGDSIHIDQIEDIVDAPPVTQPSTQWNNGKPTGGVIGEDGKVISEEEAAQQAGEGEEEGETEGAVDGEPVGFEKRTDDLLNPGEEEEGGTVAGEAEEADVDKDFYQGLSGILSEKGLLTVGDKPITSEEDFVAAYENEVASRLDQRTRAIEEYMKAGVPYTAVSKIESAIVNTNNITAEHIEADQDLAKNLIMAEFSQRGFDQETSERYFEMFKSTGKVTEEALTALESRKATLGSMLQQEVENAKNAKKEAIQAKEKQVQDLIKGIESGNILNRKVTPVTQNKLKNVLTSVVGYTSDGQPMNAIMKYKEENPVDFEKNVLYLYTVTDGFTNLGVFDRSAESRVSRQFKNAVSTISSGKSFIEKSSTPNKTKIDMDLIDDIV